MFTKPRESTAAPSLDLTPIIDMVFLLLIFFLVATTFQQTEREMKIALPVASAAGPISSMLREIIINVDEQGRFVINGRETSDTALAELLSAAMTRNPEQKVSVRGDRHCPYAHIARALDLCKSAGFQQPFLDTIPAN